MKRLLQTLLIFIIATGKPLAQSFTSSNLPIFIIDTHGEYIQDEPKINAGLQIINNKNKARNKITDSFEFESLIGIEFRGSSSQLFPKKSFGFEIRDSSGKSSEASILGFPKDEDWVLFASYNEKSLIHNTLAMKIARDQGMYASRTRHVELILNGEYQGVYVLMERIKRTTSRANVTKMSDKDNAGDAVTGGYIFKIDKTTGSEEEIGWFSKVPPVKSPQGQSIYYQFDYPKPSNVTPQQRNYLQAYVDSAETALNSANFTDKINGYRKYFDTKSFVDIFLINEVSKNVDGYRISTFFTKERTGKGGKIKAGPAWDYDLAFANCEYCETADVEGWSYLYGDICPDDFWEVPFHWSKMLQDPEFVTELKTQYQTLRNGAWNTERLMAHIDSLAEELEEAQVRNFEKWPVLGTYVWPNPKPIPTTWQGEVDELKSWLSQRLIWMDNYLPGLVTAIEEKPAKEITVQLSENPSLQQLSFSIVAPRPMEVLVELIDSNGKCLYRKHQLLLNDKNDFEEPIKEPAGIYFLRIHTAREVVVKKFYHL